MREIRSSGSVGELPGNRWLYPEFCTPRPGSAILRILFRENLRLDCMKWEKVAFPTTFSHFSFAPFIKDIIVLLK